MPGYASARDRLIVGCGYLGRRLLALWVRAGYRVRATTRTAQGAAELASLGAIPVVCDVMDPGSLQALPPVHTLVYAVAPDPMPEADRRQLQSLGPLRVEERCRPERFVFVSSTGVYATGHEGLTDEAAPAEPDALPSHAEVQLRLARTDAMVLRLAGIYGSDRVFLLPQLKAGIVKVDPAAWLNVVHVDDAAQAVDQAALVGCPGRVYNVSDGVPVIRERFYGWMADRLGLPRPRFEPAPGRGADGNPGRTESGRRIDNRRMLDELAVELRFPDYRSGLAAALSPRPAA